MRTKGAAILRTKDYVRMIICNCVETKKLFHYERKNENNQRRLLPLVVESIVVNHLTNSKVNRKLLEDVTASNFEALRSCLGMDFGT